MISTLEGKRILFIGVGFYQYEDYIKNALTKKGAIVEYVVSFIATQVEKNIQKISKNFIQNKIKKWERITLSKCTGKYDYVFVIKGEGVSKAFLEQLKLQNKNAYFILYEWDSIKRLPFLNEISECFDIVYTFDRIDAQTNKNMIFQPLFYVDSHLTVSKQKEFDLFFVGVYYEERFEVLKKLIDQCETLGLNYYFYLYTHRTTILKKKLFTREHRKYISILKSRSLSYSQYQKKLLSSSCVLDFHHLEQYGLTMRTIEVLSMKKKLLTTNTDIVNYGFPRTQYRLIDPHIPELDIKFIKEYFVTNEDFDFEWKYSLNSWIKSVFNLSS